MKEKVDILREDIIHNFLKQTIFRIDYDYLFPNQISQLMENLDAFFSEKKFRIEKDVRNDFQLNFDGNGIGLNQNQEEFSNFVSEDNNVFIEITRQYVCITLLYKSDFISFDEIKDYMNKIYETLKNVRNNIHLKRIGLRKINAILLENIEKYRDVFESGLFDNLMGFNQLSMYRKNELYTSDDNSISINAGIDTGVLNENNQEKNFYQFLFDIDVSTVVDYSEDDTFDKLNNLLFSYFKAGIKKEFLNNMIDANFEIPEGVKLKW